MCIYTGGYIISESIRVNAVNYLLTISIHGFPTALTRTSLCLIFFPVDSLEMVLVSVLNNTLVNIANAERRGKRQVLVRPSSKVVIKFLQVMQKNGESSDTSASC